MVTKDDVNYRAGRTAAKEKLTQTSELREVLQKLVHTYNTVWVHSTTKQIPVMRFEDALNNNLCLFKSLQSVRPNTDIRDIFCMRVERKVDGYRNVRFENTAFTLPKATPGTTIEIRIIPNVEKGIAELRFWHKNTFLDRLIVWPLTIGNSKGIIYLTWKYASLADSIRCLRLRVETSGALA